MSEKIEFDSQDYAIKCLLSTNSAEEIVSETKECKNIFLKSKMIILQWDTSFLMRNCLILLRVEKKYYQGNETLSDHFF